MAYAGFFRSPGFYVRVSVLGLVTLGLFGLLGLRLWSLQLVQSKRYERAARQEVFRFVSLPAPRAPIVDRRGRPLAGTEARVAITADADTLGAIDDDGRWRPSPQGWSVLQRFSRRTGIPLRRLLRRIQRDQLRSPHAPAVVLPTAPESLRFYLDERAELFPGLHTTPFPARSYPEGRLGAEFLGLLGEISDKQLKHPRWRGRRLGEVIGQSGVEATYDRVLNFGLARARVAVDARGRAIGPLTVVEQPRPTHALRLTIDVRIQRAAERAIKLGVAAARRNGHYDARSGAAVVMDARTGAIYALASRPSYNQVAAARNPDYLADLLDERIPGQPLVNRAIAGVYPLGSTFKPIVAQAALAAGLISPSSYLGCPSGITVGGRTFSNAGGISTGALNLRGALKISCDTWFYQLGLQFYNRQNQGSLDMQRWAWRLGIGRRSGVDLPGEAIGMVPTPRLLETAFDEIWYPGYSVNLSIGQGYLQSTPLQLAVAYAALANGGGVVRPHVASGLYDGSGRLRRRFRFPARRVGLAAPGAIREGLIAAANEPGGTSASVFAGFRPTVAGKTGTAEAPPGSDHSWYASWAPAHDARIVVVVLIEHGGFGAEAAAPAARSIYESFFGTRQGRPRS